MRRALSTLLLLLIGFPLIAQALVRNQAPAVPACCRRAGVHHCTMPGQPGHAGSGPQVGQLRCPLFPHSSTIVSSARFIAPEGSGTVAVTKPIGFAEPSQTRFSFRLILLSSNHKRGPPSLLNSL